MADRISRQRASIEGWLSAREVRDATGLGHATLQERFQNATRDGLRVARLESGEWRLHKDDLAKLPRRYEAKGAPRSRMEELAQELALLRAEVAALKEKIAELARHGGHPSAPGSSAPGPSAPGPSAEEDVALELDRDERPLTPALDESAGAHLDAEDGRRDRLEGHTTQRRAVRERRWS